MSIMRTYLDFEKTIAEIEDKITELRELAGDGNEMQIEGNLKQLEKKASGALKELYSSLTPWQKTQVARHPDRPHFFDYAKVLFDDFIPMAGDRKFADDNAIIGGPARFRSRTVMAIGHEKGSTTEARLKHNFGMARPEGYRKAARLMETANRFSLPLISIVDTAGAYPGIGAEQRGQAEAIARCTQTCLNAEVPFVSVIIGEGGSGGAIAIASANTVLMLEHAIYAVASPEASASILWRDAARAKDAADTMKITAQDLLNFGVIDTIVSEPVGGAHRDPMQAVIDTGNAIEAALKSMETRSSDELKKQRQERFIGIGRGL
jgi:acetyl-CoA carboxylase carboxyl transferase subunit alpha